VETAGNRNLQTRTYKQEIQLIQVARIGQAGRGTSIDAGTRPLFVRPSPNTYGLYFLSFRLFFYGGWGWVWGWWMGLWNVLVISASFADFVDSSLIMGTALDPKV
jgi:hypothetical protein